MSDRPGKTWRDVRPQVLGVPARTPDGEPLAAPENAASEVLVEWFEMDERFARPLGGGMHFGESSRTAVVREFREETGNAVRVTDRLGVVENVFDLAGETHHELAVVHAVRFEDETAYDRAEMAVEETDGSERTATWHAVADLRERPEPLYPEAVGTMLAGETDHVYPEDGE